MDLAKTIRKEELSKQEKDKVSMFAFWKDKAELEYDSECGSCSSFCSSGSCTTCTGVTDKVYLKTKIYRN